MQITVDLPDDLATYPEPAREALEALAIAGFRSGTLSSYEARLLLGFQTRCEFDGFLKQHNIWEQAYGIEDLQHDRADLDGSA